MMAKGPASKGKGRAAVAACLAFAILVLWPMARPRTQQPIPLQSATPTTVSTSTGQPNAGGRTDHQLPTPPPAPPLPSGPSCIPVYLGLDTGGHGQPGHGPRCLYQARSRYHDLVTVLEMPEGIEQPYKIMAGSRVLVLGTHGDVHSIWRYGSVLTHSYWDHMAALTALVPPGPIAVLGVGAGTVPSIMAEFFPERGVHVHGWELDAALLTAARGFLGLKQLEDSGRLAVHLSDPLLLSATLPGGFAGIMVDLFANGKLLPQLTQRATYESLLTRLHAVPGARLIVNLGPAPPAFGIGWRPAALTTLRALSALKSAMGGRDVSVLRVNRDGGTNAIALTGPLPTRKEWPGMLPAGLRHVAEGGSVWRTDLQAAAAPSPLPKLPQ